MTLKTGIRWLALIYSGVGCFLSLSCVTPPPPPPTLPITNLKPLNLTTIVSNDVLIVQVYGEKDLSGKFQVSDDGTIDYPLVGRLRVSGLTPPEITDKIRLKLADGYLKNPQVSVLVEGFEKKKIVVVWGQVKNPGTYTYVPNMPLIKAITDAGGLTPLADKGRVTVTRDDGSGRGKSNVYTVPLRDNFAQYPVQPGDVIFVPERLF